MIDIANHPGLDDAANFARACHQLLGATSSGDTVSWSGADDEKLGAAARRVRTGTVPISIDFAAVDELARTPAVRRRAQEIRTSLGNPLAMPTVPRATWLRLALPQAMRHHCLTVALASSADAVVLVAQARRTTRRNLVSAMERLSRVGANVVGIVLNQAKRVNAGEYAYRYDRPRSDEVWVRHPDAESRDATRVAATSADPLTSDPPAVAEAPLS